VKNYSTSSDDASALPPGSGSATTVRPLGGFARQLLGGAALAALLVTGSVAARADESNAELAAEIHALKAQLSRLEGRVEKQRVVIHQVQVKANTFQANAAAPYEPAGPWDKKFHLNGITMTPGGFFAMEGVYRSRDQGADFNAPFGTTPLAYNNPLSHLNEIRGTARQSRVSMLIQGNYNPDVLISGYGELDFLGAGNTANSNESNSYQPRIRHMYATIDWLGEGFHLLAGQTWSLVTLNGKGITPRNEVVPLTIDAQYVVGFNWTRTPQFRLVKNFGDQFWLAASAEMPQTAGITGCSGTTVGASASVGTFAVPGAGTAVCNQTSIGGGLLNQVTTYSINHVPDFVVKAAWEPTFFDRSVHIEGFGLYTDLYDGVEPLTTLAPAGTFVKHDTSGWGAGGSIAVAAIPHWVDLQGTAMIGRGIGRYGSSGLNNATFNPDGSLYALPELSFMGGAVVHATPTLDLYTYGGQERILSSGVSSSSTGVLFGYSPLSLNNSGCYTIGGTCTGNTKDVWEVTAGLWDKVYQGAFGSIKVGVQYEYIQRELFPTTAGSVEVPSYSTPRFNENAAYVSFRYYPFDPPPPPPPVIAKY
jgi:hypothetical protein